MFDEIRNLEVGRSIRWENPPMSCGMIADYLNDGTRQYAVRWICTNWEASLGYTLITRHA
jgi:hypothetical protein